MSARFFAFFCSLVFCLVLLKQYYVEETAKQTDLTALQVLQKALPLQLSTGVQPKPEVIFQEREKIVYKYIYATGTTPLASPSVPVTASPTAPLASNASATPAIAGSPEVASGTAQTPPDMAAPPEGEIASPTLLTESGQGATETLKLRRDPRFLWPVSPVLHNPFIETAYFIPREPPRAADKKGGGQVQTLPEGITLSSGASTSEEVTIVNTELPNLYKGVIVSGPSQTPVKTALLGGRAYNLNEFFPDRSSPEAKEIVIINEQYVLMKRGMNLFYAFYVKLDPILLAKNREKFIKS